MTAAATATKPSVASFFAEAFTLVSQFAPIVPHLATEGAQVAADAAKIAADLHANPIAEIGDIQKIVADVATPVSEFITVLKASKTQTL